MMDLRTTIRRAPQGFTILELIVAISITVIMLFLINALFVATSNGVSMGMAMSDVIGAGRAIGDQLERDSNQQFSPRGSPPGVLVIVCEKLPDIPFKFRGAVKQRAVRSDQFLFTRKLQGSSKFNIEPIAPIDATTYSAPTKTQMAAAEAVRVWYGHVLKTNDAGTAATGLGVAGRNELANQWALGRHALFFVGSSSAPTFNHCVGGRADATVSTHIGGGSLFQGTTDVAYTAYSNDTSSAGTFLGNSSMGATSVNPGITLWADLDKTDYDNRALALMFRGANRLWVNPSPKVDATNTATWVTARQVAQSHALLMDNVSDFIVEFAADAIEDPNLPAGNGADFDGEPDRDPTTQEIIWYGLAANPDTNSMGPPTWNLRTLNSAVYYSPVVSTGGDSAGYVFRQATSAAPEYYKLWPYMIRIRYRLHDMRAELGGDPSPEKDMPDSTGSLGGRWFEQIIKVNRD